MVIVAAVDRSERATPVVEQAAVLAARFDDPIHAVHVMTRSEVTGMQSEGANRGEISDVEGVRADAARVAADALEAAAPGVESDAVGRIGTPADEIVEYAAEQDARYIVVSPHRRSQAGKILFGSVAQSVLLNAGCPVVSVLAD
jgi:nucleotide-binding universal stress UspA family protein